VVRLPNGDGFQYALSSWESASGESIEGIGVIPDEEILLDRKMLSKHADPVLSAARKWILEEHKN
jgi:C-terminal processing protease CtpA/Prc